jgi:hypothetical protein
MMGSEIVVPKYQALEELNKKLAPLIEQAKAIQIKTPQDRITAAGVLTGLRAYTDAVKYQTGPEIAATKEKLAVLRQEQATLLEPAVNWMEILKDQDARYREEERRQAQVEQDRKNAELARQAREKAEADRLEAERLAHEERKRKITEINRYLADGKIGKREAARQLKAAGAAEEAAKQDAAAAEEEAKAAPPPTVTVKPNIPAVAGAPRAQVYFYGDVRDENAIIAAYNVALLGGNEERVVFLGRFLIVDRQAVAKFARDTKDNEKAAEQLPGVRFYSKG